MVRDMDNEPACYELQQFFIDHRFQNRGYREKERKYSNIEVCVKMEDKAAIHVYKEIGFIDTKYISSDAPDAYNLRYSFNDSHE